MAEKVHGSKGVWCAGRWVDIEDCGEWLKGGAHSGEAAAARNRERRSMGKNGVFDVVVVGAGCVGGSIARELCKFDLSVLVLERDDDVTQGATKGNSGIVHAGYDDKPGSVRAKFCPSGNRMFPQLDKELKFGFLKNGSLVCATSPKEELVLQELLERGKKNGVENIRILNKEEVHKLEPHLNPNVTAALLATDAGTVTPYEFAIALCENAADNGADIRIRHQVTSIEKLPQGGFVVRANNWDPALGRSAGSDEQGAASTAEQGPLGSLPVALSFCGILLAVGVALSLRTGAVRVFGVLLSIAAIFFVAYLVSKTTKPRRGRSDAEIAADAIHPTLAFQAPKNQGREEVFRTRFVVNAAGLFADKVAAMVGDDSFKIKPRLGDYLLLHKNQGHLAKHTLFPTPDPKYGKGVLVQTTLWGNLILGPTARDTYDEKSLKMSDKEVFEYIIGKCRELVPSLDAGQVIHSFCGARAKSDRGDWIIEESVAAKGFFHAAGIDSPGLAGSPSIALEIVRLLQSAGLELVKDTSFDPVRRPLIVPKNNWKTCSGKNLKVYKEGSKPGEVPADQHVLCKCEKVTEEEILLALRSSLPVDNTQAIRRRTRAGMGHCQAGEFPHCEDRVAELIAREKGIPLPSVGKRPWPATSLLPQRWLTEEQRTWFRSLVPHTTN